MTCKLCKQFRADYPIVSGEHRLGDGKTMDPIVCAFEHGLEFSSDNRHCQTMIALRRFAEELGLKVCHNDSNYAVLPVHADVPDWDVGVIVMSWYKRRGRTGRALVMCDADFPVTLGLPVAEQALFHFEKEEKKRCAS